MRKRLRPSRILILFLATFSFAIAHPETTYAKGEAAKALVLGIGKALQQLFKKPPKRISKTIKPTISQRILPKIGDAALQEVTSFALRGAIKSVSRTSIQPQAQQIFRTQNNFLSQATQNYAPQFIESAKSKLTLKGVAYSVGGQVISHIVFSKVAHALDLDSSGSMYADAQFNAEIAAGMEKGIEDFYIKVCTDNQGLEYGVPSDTVRCLNGTEPKMIEAPINLRKIAASQSGTYPWVGVRIISVSDEAAETFGLRRPYGALVENVSENSPASRAGIMVGDVVLSFDGTIIEDMPLLPEIVSKTPVNKRVSVDVLRDGVIYELPLVVGFGYPPPSPYIQSLGMRIETISNDIRNEYKISNSEEGFIITDVEAGSSAAKKGVRRGDIITEVALESVISPDHISKRIQETKNSGKSSVLLRLKRDGETTFVALRFE